MTIRSIEEYPKGKVKVDLTGPGGNAFSLLALATQYGKIMYGKEETDRILTEMKALDYENLIQVFDEYFGCYIDLYR